MSDPPAPAGATEAFAAHVAHDFNNLLTGILGNLELMQNRTRRNGHPDYDTYIEGARSAALRAAGLAQRLLVLSGRQAGEPVATDLTRLAGDLVAPLQAQGHDITLDMPALILTCDPNHAELAMNELLENAIAATPVGGRITLSAAHEAGQIVLKVCDTGAGMAPETLARAVQPFFTTRPNGTGRGLGLAIAEGFARSLGGALTLVSTRGEGTTAVISVPREQP